MSHSLVGRVFVTVSQQIPVPPPLLLCTTLMHLLLPLLSVCAVLGRQVKEAKQWIDVHLAHLDFNSDLPSDQQSSCERLRRTATYILQV